jgi:Integrase core domain
MTSSSWSPTFCPLAVKDDETEHSAVAFLKEAIRALPFQVTHVLTDRDSCFTADGLEAACQSLGVEPRTTRPYTPRTHGMEERFHGRVQREGLGITLPSHADLETLLQGFHQAYNARRQRVLGGRSPETVARERLGAAPARANPTHDPPLHPGVLSKVFHVIAHSEDVSHQDTSAIARGWLRLVRLLGVLATKGVFIAPAVVLLGRFVRASASS